MAVHLSAPNPQDIHVVPGVRIGITEAGVRKANRKDLTVFLLDEGASVAGVFTKNRFCAAPVQVCRDHLAAGQGVRAIVINTGNANAGTGASGLAHARQTSEAMAKLLGCNAQQVLPFSTGVIMEPLPVDKIIAAMPKAIELAQADAWAVAAEGIMTTDTVPKAASVQVQIDGVTVTVTGISKGAGMIRPNMATMLGYLATDAAIAPELMTDLAKTLADGSFNCVTVDGDTSTNDSFVVMATHKAAHAPITSWGSAQGQALMQAMLQVARQLAHAIVRDGEGATKFITIAVEGGRDADVTDAPLLLERLQDRQLGRRVAQVVHLDEVDLRLPHALERGLDLRPRRRRVGTATAAAGHVELGGELPGEGLPGRVLAKRAAAKRYAGVRTGFFRQPVVGVEDGLFHVRGDGRAWSGHKSAA